MHARKTGAVIRASVLMAAECVPRLDPNLYAALTRFATAVGLAFQIQDDLLDVIGDASTLGKATGADSERAKPTHPAVIGIPASQQRVRHAAQPGDRALGAIRRACGAAAFAWPTGCCRGSIDDGLPGILCVACSRRASSAGIGTLMSARRVCRRIDLTKYRH